MGSAGAKRSATPLWSDAPPAPKALLRSHARPATESAVAAPLCRRTPNEARELPQRLIDT
ncbi:MAG TPA: hypothetical protein DCE44_24555 [Verrucomicrobiales bacterium]|nr:hypothetical protein [Verrucomicrobiales bacterium]